MQRLNTLHSQSMTHGLKTNSPENFQFHHEFPPMVNSKHPHLFPLKMDMRGKGKAFFMVLFICVLSSPFPGPHIEGRT